MAQFWKIGLVAAALFGAAGVAVAEIRDLSGSVSYRERIAMPEGARVEVSLQDISLADAPSVELARIVLRPEGNVPVAYRMSYDDAMVRDAHSYAVQAKIVVDGDVLWRTTSVFPALTRGAPETVDVMLEKMPMQEAAEMPDVLTSSEWLVVVLDGKELQSERLPQMRFDADGRVSGSSGCNRFTGSVDISAGGFAFGPLASTRMACPAALGAQETQFFAALERVTGYNVQNGAALVDADGREVMRLMAE
ncbi:YbaY family lipoprotein [Shimia sp. Alg240-R146]|uniref:YbaY family lipoprotein n=1 Tax=Shimia sp. Alg240-R146 TaxID=2993449 RepID=UPI0022E68DCD|nr:YbaY family lipoprotein [Shimia sp. Alg240-R146]